MLNTVPTIIIVSTTLGFLSGLGVGGGSLLILWLTLVVQMPGDTARSINLLFFLPAALIAGLFYRKKGTLPFRKILPGIIGGIVGAVLFTQISRYISSDALRIPFGILLLITGIRELFYRPRKPK